MVRIDPMADRIFGLDRRELMAGLGAAVLGPAMPRIAAADGRRSLTLQAKADTLALRSGAPETPIWSLQSPAPEANFRFTRGDELEIALWNELPTPVVLNCRGVDGVPPAAPLALRPPLSGG